MANDVRYYTLSEDMQEEIDMFNGNRHHHERIHQGVGRIIEPKHATDVTAEIVCIERLGGLLKSYHRLAA